MAKKKRAVATVKNLPLSKLSLALENVRKTPPSAAAEAELLASVREHGLLKNLAVKQGKDPAGEAHWFVVAGGRRLAALQKLAREGVIEADAPVPCKVVPGAWGEEISYVENVTHVAMHPADQIVAFGKLVREGTSIAEIAARYGVSERVARQRVALSHLAPEVIQAYRDRRFDMETLQAFTLNGDQDRQREVLEGFARWGRAFSAFVVRSELADKGMWSDRPIAKFVGVDTYEAAGGRVVRDLFSELDEGDRVLLQDGDLVRKIAGEILDDAKKDIESSWAWVEACVTLDYNHLYRHTQVDPESRGDFTPEERAELNNALAQARELDARAKERELTEEECEALHEADQVEQRLEEKVRARDDWSSEQRSYCGVILTIDEDGGVCEHSGLVRKEDLDRIPKVPGAAPPQGEPVPPPFVNMDPPEPGAEPETGAARPLEQSLPMGVTENLRRVRGAVVKAQVARNFQAAFDLLTFQIAGSMLDETLASQEALDISVRRTEDGVNEGGGVAHPGVRDLVAARERLDDDWCNEDRQGEGQRERFRQFCALPEAMKKKLFAYAVAQTLKHQLSSDHWGVAAYEATVRRLGIDWARKVPASRDLFWQRLTKAQIAQIAEDVLGSTWLAQHKSAKKDELVVAVDAAFRLGQGESASYALPGFEPEEVEE